MTVQELKPPTRYRLTVADYLTLDREGAFAGLRTELIEGEIIVMNPQTRRHLVVKSELGYRMRRALEAIGNDLFVAIDGTVEIAGDRYSLPEPDIFLTDEPHGEGYVEAQSVRLAVEVAATSLDIDLKKASLYARNLIAEYWIVDVNDGIVHQMWAPADETYAERRQVFFGEMIRAATIAGLTVSVAGI